MLERDGAEISGHHRALSHHVALAEGRPARRKRIVIDIGSREHDAGVEGQKRFARQAFMKLRQNARRFVHGSGTDFPLKQLRRVCGGAGDVEPPAGRAAAGHDCGLRVAVPVLERQHDVGFFGRPDERRPRQVERPPATLFITRHEDGDAHVVELAGAGQRLQRMDDDDVTPLHVHDSGSLRPVTLAREALVRTARLEHGVQVPDEKQSRPAPVAAGDEVTRAIPGRSVHPFCLEAQRIELAAEEHPHLPHAVEVHGAAVDVHGPLEEVDRLDRASVDFARDPLL